MQQKMEMAKMGKTFFIMRTGSIITSGRPEDKVIALIICHWYNKAVE